MAIAYNEMQMELVDSSFIEQALTSEILANVVKPARYIGGEYGLPPAKESNFRVCLAFPDLYEVGMSHIGLKILYSMINSIEGASCERAFAPALDMQAEMVKHGVPLYALESFDPLLKFDAIGFSLEYELCLSNVFYMLELSGIPVYANERGDECPIILAGGPNTTNPEPIKQFFDAIFVGEAEESLNEAIKALMALKLEGRGRAEMLQKLSDIEGVFVPKFPKAKIKRAYIKDITHAHYPESFIVPNIEIIHDRAAIEVMRGCARGCRFCQAGYIYRPLRMKELSALERQGKSLMQKTGYSEVSLSSLSSTDYYYCTELIASLNEAGINKASLPSLRMDSENLELIKNVKGSSIESLTFAPEAGSQRMRDVINKNLSESTILNTAMKAFEMGCKKMKLYFMIGLPYENEDDVAAIATLANKILSMSQEKKIGRKLSLSVSVAAFVPKPHTPFEFFGQDSIESLAAKRLILIKSLYKSIKLSSHDPYSAVVESALARGTEATGRAAYNAYKAGARFDSWSESFDYQIWVDAFKLEGLSLVSEASKCFGFDEDLPWGYIDNGVSLEFLKSEAIKAKEGETTLSCFESCSQCGISETRCKYEV